MALTLVFWTAVIMGGVVGLGTVLGPRVTAPIFEDTQGVMVPSRVVRLLRYGTIAGGMVATFGFLLLATAEWFRLGELGLVGIAGIVIGGPVFSVAVGASIALVVRVRVVERNDERQRRSPVEE